MLVIYVIIIVDLTHDLNLVFSKVKFPYSCISGFVGLIDVKQKGSESLRYWAEYMTLPFDRSEDLYIVVSRTHFRIASSQE